MGQARYVALMGKKMIAYRLSVSKPEGKRQLGRPRRRWDENIEMYLRSIGWGVMDCALLAQERDNWRTLMKTVINLRVS
jgi:hypothetical protein